MTKNEITRAAAVYRVSTGAQTTGGGDDEGQAALAEQMATSRGWQIVATFDETADTGYQSGRARIEDRPYIQAMIQAARQGAFDVAIFKNPSRGSREVLGLGEVARSLREHSVLIAFSETGQVLDWHDSMDQIVILLGGWQADMDWSQMKKNHASGRGRHARAGGFVAGIPPTGYRRQGGKGDDRNVLVIEEAEAEQIRFAFDRILAGDNVNAATEALNARWPGYRGKRGGVGFKSGTVASWLSSGLYGGLGGEQWITPAATPRRDHSCEKVRGKTSTYCRTCKNCAHGSTIETVEGRSQCTSCGKIAYGYEAPAIISADDYRKVQRLLKKAKAAQPVRVRTQTRPYGLSGLLVHEEATGGRSLMHGASSRATRRYRCSHAVTMYHKRWDGRDGYEPCTGLGIHRKNGLPGTSVSAPQVEADLMLLLVDILQDPKSLSEIESYAARQDDALSQTADSLEAAEAEREALKRQRENLKASARHFSPEEVDAMMAEWQADWDRNAGRIARLQDSHKAIASVRVTFDDLMTAAIGWQDFRPGADDSEDRDWWLFLLGRLQGRAQMIRDGRLDDFDADEIALLGGWAARLGVTGTLTDEGGKVFVSWSAPHGSVFRDALAYSSDDTEVSPGEYAAALIPLGTFEVAA